MAIIKHGDESQSPVLSYYDEKGNKLELVCEKCGSKLTKELKDSKGKLICDKCNKDN